MASMLQNAQDKERDSMEEGCGNVRKVPFPGGQQVLLATAHQAEFSPIPLVS